MVYDKNMVYLVTWLGLFFGWRTWCFWLVFSFDWNIVFVVLIGVFGVSIGVFLYQDGVLGV